MVLTGLGLIRFSPPFGLPPNATNWPARPVSGQVAHDVARHCLGWRFGSWPFPFFKKALSSQSAISLPCHSTAFWPSACRPPSMPNGGFVPNFGRGRSFVINQIGGFVFQKSSRLSAVSHQLQVSRAEPTVPLPTAYYLLPSVPRGVRPREPRCSPTHPSGLA